MIIPAGNRVLLKADPIEIVSKGGIIQIASTESEKLERAAQTNGTLVSVGKEAWEDYSTHWAEVGDRVSYIRHAGTWINDPTNNEEYVLLNDLDILAIITEEA